VFLVGPWQLLKTSTTLFYLLQKPAPGVLVAEEGNVHRGLRGAKVHPIQGMRNCAKGCMALGVVAALPLTIPSGHQGGFAGGDLFPHYSWGIYEEHTKQSTYQKPGR